MRAALLASVVCAVAVNSAVAGTFVSNSNANVVKHLDVKHTKAVQRSPAGEKACVVAAGLDNASMTREILAGLIASLATLPTSISYASICGLNPVVGVWTTVIIGSIVSIIGGAPGVITGGAGVVAIPMGKVLANYGPSYMAATVLVSGLIEALFGIFRMGKVVEIVQEPVIAGFLNAFAVFLVKSQLKLFKAAGTWLPSDKMVPAVAIAAFTAALILSVPYVTTAVPSSLVALFLATVVSKLFKLPLKTLEDVGGKAAFSGGLSALPSFTGLPNVPLNLDTLKTIVPVAMGVMVISLVETLLASKITTSQFRSKVEGYAPDDPNQTAMGLGLGTAVSGLFGGFGGCGLIPNTILCGKSGGITRLSSFFVSVFLALFVLVLAPVIAQIPMAALAGLMFLVAYNTFEWHETQHIAEAAPKSIKQALDLVALIATFALCFVDMGVGVFAGVFITFIAPILKLK